MCGKLELIIGPMFSGKSTELIRKIRLLKIIKRKVLVLKPSIDNRYLNGKITSHNYDSVDCKVIKKLEEISDDDVKNYDTVIIDEGQFFTDLKNNVIKWIDDFSIDVIIGALDGDFEKQPFGQILELIPHSNNCTKLNSLCSKCSDGTEAPFSLRIIKSSDIVLIGGIESYIPVCRKHFNILKNE